MYLNLFQTKVLFTYLHSTYIFQVVYYFIKKNISGKVFTNKKKTWEGI
jgi:hypothetical protein